MVLVRARFVVAAVFLVACSENATVAPAGADASAEGGACTTLFGVPNAHTGLDATQCQPACSCGGATFAPPAYDAAFVAKLRTDWTLATPFAPPTTDPYASPAPPPDPPDTVCAVLPIAGAATPRPYSLVTYASEADARAAGASPTHFGRCGLCSTLANLAVYIENQDLTAPVRQCGLDAPDHAGDVACLEKLGFDEPCAAIWAYNTAHTRAACLSPCLAALGKPYQEPDGTLNPCLQCDEDQSGAVFKAVAGRTRRNSGLPNALCRPCSEVRPLVHDY